MRRDRGSRLSEWALSIAVRADALNERGRQRVIELLDRLDRIEATRKRVAVQLRDKPAAPGEWFGSLH